MTRLPVRLERPPLIEAVLEVRFSGSQDSVGDLLPGLLFASLGKQFAKVEPLPIAAIPRVARAADPNLRYQPHVRLSGGNSALLVGDYVASISKSPPYSGWGAFREMCLATLDVLNRTGLLGSVERYSFKCMNLIEPEGRPPFEVLNGELRLGTYRYTDRGFRLRAELEQGGFVTLLEAVGSTTVNLGDKTESRAGLLLAVDSLAKTTAEEFWANPAQRIDAAHDVTKEVFFSLLTPKVIEELGPVWG